MLQQRLSAWVSSPEGVWHALAATAGLVGACDVVLKRLLAAPGQRRQHMGFSICKLKTSSAAWPLNLRYWLHSCHALGAVAALTSGR